MPACSYQSYNWSMLSNHSSQHGVIQGIVFKLAGHDGLPSNAANLDPSQFNTSSISTRHSSSFTTSMTTQPVVASTTTSDCADKLVRPLSKRFFTTVEIYTRNRFKHASYLLQRPIDLFYFPERPSSDSMLPAYPFLSCRTHYKDLGLNQLRTHQYFPNMERVFDNFSTCFDYISIDTQKEKAITHHQGYLQHL